jgi:hypothetical protein
LAILVNVKPLLCVVLVVAAAKPDACTAVHSVARTQNHNVLKQRNAASRDMQSARGSTFVPQSERHVRTTTTHTRPTLFRSRLIYVTKLTTRDICCLSRTRDKFCHQCMHHD